MEYIICPKCKTETDPKEQMCQLCGKFIIYTELSPSDKRKYSQMWSKGEIKFGLDPGSKEKEEDLFERLGPLSLEDELDGITQDNFDLEKEEKASQEKIKKEKEKLFKQSKLLQHIQEEEDLFGDLDD